MVNPIEQFKEWQLRRQLRQGFNPEKNTLTRNRNIFLSHFPNKGTPIIHWKPVFAVIMIGLLSTGGMITYADTANVAPTHPLYGFKRMGELIRLGLATPQQQVQLQQIFAQRRLEEINEIETDKKASASVTEIQTLRQDFQNEADNTINQAEVVKLHHDERMMICQTLLNSAQGDHLVMPNQLQHLMHHCQQTQQRQDD